MADDEQTMADKANADAAAAAERKAQRDQRLGFDEYQVKAAATLHLKVKMMGGFAMLQNAALGMVGEGGEFADMIKKVIYHDHPFDEPTKDKLVKEIGGVLWYCALACTALDVSLRDTAKLNIDKLTNPSTGRYKAGVFSVEESLSRSDVNPSDLDYGRLPNPQVNVFVDGIKQNTKYSEADDGIGPTTDTDVFAEV